MSHYSRYTPGSSTNPNNSYYPSSSSSHPLPSNNTRRSTLVATNNVTTKDGTTVRVRIDPTLAVDDVIRQLCVNLKIQEPPVLFALRDENDELITDDNLRKKIKAKANLKLANAPAIEAAEIVEKLVQKDDKVLRMTLFNLQKFIREEQFATEFLKRGGLDYLVEVISSSSGNILAYALTSMQHLMELDYGWSTLDNLFILKIVQILSSSQSLINVCRPATAILKKLVEADPGSTSAPPTLPVAANSLSPGGAFGESSRGAGLPGLPGSVYRYGFDVVFEQMRKERGFLETVLTRLGSADSMTVLYSMMLINSLLLHATETRWNEFTSEFERLNFNKAVVRLMSSHAIEDITSCILDFQANMVRIIYRKKITPVSVTNDAHFASLHYIWSMSKLEEDTLNSRGARSSGGSGTGEDEEYVSVSLGGKLALNGSINGNGTGISGISGIHSSNGLGGTLNGTTMNVNGTSPSPNSSHANSSSASGSMLKWRKIGFETEDPAMEFQEMGVGELGLDCLRHFVMQDPDYFANTVLEQISRPAERRCPIAKASCEIVQLLAEHYAIFAPGYSTSTSFQPFFLTFYKVHILGTKFFLRMWNESGAAAGDFSRVVALASSQIKVALRDENTRPWHEVEHDFLGSEYRAVRDRQMKELEMEDDLLNKVPVRNLRAKLYKESYEFVRQQRLQCLLQGAWFVNGVPLNSQNAREPNRRPARPWRFMKLDSSLKYLHYVDSAVKFQTRSGVEDLPERIDISLISEIATGTCAPPPNVLRENINVPSSSLVASPLSFSLLSAHEGSLADQIAQDASRWADWTDGLNMLRRDGGHAATQETAEFVQALTEMGLKIKLLYLSGERIEIPAAMYAGPPPPSMDFVYSDNLDEQAAFSSSELQSEV